MSSLLCQFASRLVFHHSDFLLGQKLFCLNINMILVAPMYTDCHYLATVTGINDDPRKVIFWLKIRQNFGKLV